MRRKRLCALGVLCVVSAIGSACMETGTVQVSSITFKGNQAIDPGSLKTVIATQENSILPFSRSHYFDRAEFERDLKRIEAYYADHGYPHAKVTGVDVKLNTPKDHVDITINISEGPPTIVESIAFEGLDAIPPDHLAKLKAQVPFAPGDARDQTLILAAHDMAVNELKDHGFPYGTVKIVERPGSGPDCVQLAFVAETGPNAVFGAIQIEGNQSVDENVIRRELTFHEGGQYRLSEITESQRRLYGLELFQFANITPRLPEDRAPQVPVVVTVAEGKHRRLQLAAGYGSEEKARGRVNWRHVNFTGGARTLDTEAKWSSLEHGFRGTVREPYLLQSGLSVQLQGSSWWTSEPAYTYRSNGGRLIFTKELSRGAAGAITNTHNEVRVSLINEHENYAIVTSALQDLTLRDQFIALGLDPTTGKGNGTLSAVEIDFDRDTSGRPLDPRKGYRLSTHLESADSWLGGSFRYNELAGEARHYLPIGKRFVWANRVKGGSLLGQDGSKIPFFKRYFVGGSTSVRGWGRYQVSPLSASGLPIGGRSMAEVSTEARFPLSGKLSGVLFVDGGNVWAEAANIRPSGLRWAAGPGLRYDTPIGPLRVDLGIQLNPIPGLVINGSPELRKWRVHFSIGQAF
jgi:outer membrane protein assembly complex protein YaeT